MTIKALYFKKYKGLEELTVQTSSLSVLTGPNNAGKSTFLSAIRLLDAAITYAKRRSPQRIMTNLGNRQGYLIPTHHLSVSIENIHSELEDVETVVDFELDDEAIFTLYFPISGGCIFFVQGIHIPQTPTAFRKIFPFQIIQVPVLGPLEDEEPLVLESTIKRGLGTHRASRHFRNYWYRYPERFEQFKLLLSSTWEGIDIEPPEMSTGLKGGILHMFCTEFRRPRELYWCGFGFQIWCQLLTHISRATSIDIIVVDEPETYLHPTVQKQLLGILRMTGAQVFMATHSATIIASADSNEVIGINRFNRNEIRYNETGIPLCRTLGLLP